MKRFFVMLTAVLFLVLSSFAQGIDISGWKLVQTKLANTNSYTFPPGTIIPRGGYVVVGRKCTQPEFEAFWKTKMNINTVFLNANDGGVPVINGGQVFSLQNTSGQIVDGPTIQLPTSISGNLIYQRLGAALSANIPASWNLTATTEPAA